MLHMTLEETVHSRRKRWRRGGPGIVRWVRHVLHRDPCAYCGGPGGSVDHIVPVRHGGIADPTNLTSACAACNTVKGETPLLQFLLSR